MLVKCVRRRIEENGCRNVGVTVGETYAVLSIHGAYYRLFTDFADATLYPKQMFKVVDPAWPAEWLSYVDRFGELQIGTPEFEVPGFWERVHDREPTATKRFLLYLRRLGIDTRAKGEMTRKEYFSFCAKVVREKGSGYT